MNHVRRPTTRYRTFPPFTTIPEKEQSALNRWRSVKTQCEQSTPSESHMEVLQINGYREHVRLSNLTWRLSAAYNLRNCVHIRYCTTAHRKQHATTPRDKFTVVTSRFSRRALCCAEARNGHSHHNGYDILPDPC